MSNSMTVQEAIKVFEMMKRLQPKIFERNSMCEEAVNKAIKVLEYRTPKKPVVKDIGKLKIPDIAFCPICDSPVIKDKADNYEQVFCCYCGQALDWSDEE